MRKKSYEDIIHLPHHQSVTRTNMSIVDRSAQFAPFSALTGHGEAMQETARITNQKMELDEQSKVLLDTKLQELVERKSLENDVAVEFMYFQPDATKTGGEYVEKLGKLKRIDEVNRVVVLEDKTEILIDDIIGIMDEK